MEFLLTHRDPDQRRCCCGPLSLKRHTDQCYERDEDAGRGECSLWGPLKTPAYKDNNTIRSSF